MVATSASAWPTRVRGVEGTRGGAEEVQRADDLVAQPHWQGLYGGEPACWAAAVNRGQRGLGGQVGGGHRPAGAEAVQAGTLVVLQLE